MRKILSALFLLIVGISFILLLPRVNARYLAMMYLGLGIYLLLRSWWRRVIKPD
ncbi:MAG: hypothetical protein SGI98_10370 [Verrucomicrobiota bacterium]|nr:hypothetical protein [Verrucomicrobiota bacterium]